MKKINLNNNENISGKLNKLICSVWPRLTMLDVIGCNLTKEDISTIGEAINHKGLLPNIDLAVKTLLSSGHIPTVPVMCGAWKLQEVLDLTKCRLSDQDLITLAEANRYGQLPSVKEINLEGKENICGQVGYLLCSKWPVLEKLTLHKLSFSEADILAIGETVTNNFLPSIDLTLKSLSAGHIPIIPVMCGGWKSEEKLDLRMCNFSNNDMMTIVEAHKIGQLSSIKEINIEDNNKIKGQLASLLYSKWQTLEKLDIYACDLIEDDILAISAAYEKGYLPSIDQTVKSLSSSGHIPVVPVMCGAWQEQEVLDLRKGDEQDVRTIAEANRCGLLPSAIEINLKCNKFISEYVSILVSYPWSQLERLILDDSDLKIKDVEAISEANNQRLLPRIKHLSLNGNRNISGFLTRLLYNAWPKLNILEILECNLTKEDISAIHEAIEKDFLPSIDPTEKSLSSSGHIPVVPVMCGAWREQEVLDLRQCKFSQQDVITITELNRYGLLPAVREINLRYNKNVSGQLHGLLGSSTWRVLENLDLRECDLTEDDIRGLGSANRCDILPSVNNIHLGGNTNISSQVSTVLHNNWPTINVLDLVQCNLTTDNLTDIHEAKEKRFLPCIDLTVKLLQSGHIPVVPVMFGAWREQEVLDLRKCTFSKQDVIVIAEANKHGLLPSVKEINLRDSEYITGQLGALLGNSKWHSVQKLDLSFRCNLTGDDIRALREANQSGLLPSVKEINFNGNLNLSGHLGPLIGSNWLLLQKLYMQNCNLAVKDIKGLIEANRNEQLPCLEDLVLKENRKVSTHVVELLANAWKALQKLDLFQCNLTENDIQALGDANSKGFLPRLQDMVLEGNENVSGQVSPLLSSNWQFLQKLNMKKCHLTLNDIMALDTANRNGYVPCMQDLGLKGNMNPPGQIAVLLTSNWQSLRKVHLCNLTVDELGVLGDANRHGHLPCLQEFKGLGRNKNVSGQITVLLSSVWQSLLKMDLQECNLSMEDINALDKANRHGYLPSLQELVLRSNKDISGQVSVLLSSVWQCLQKLNFQECSLGAEDIRALGEANRKGHLPCLQELQGLADNKNIFGNVSVLLSGHWQFLLMLDLNWCELAIEDIKALGEANNKGYLPCLQELVLCRCRKVSGQVASLMSSKWQLLQKLNLNGCDITVDDIKALGEANTKGYLPCLKELQGLVYNNNASGQLGILLDSEWHYLKELNLECCNINGHDTKSIGKAILPSLRVLNLSSNEYCQLYPLFTNPWPTLHALDLSSCDASGFDMKALGEADLPSLQELDLSSNSRTFSGSLSLVLTHTYDTLQKLKLSSCDLTREDVRALGDANRKGYLPYLQDLDIDFNKNVANQVAALLSTKWQSLQKLGLGNCNLTVDDIRAMGEANKTSCLPSLRILDLKGNYVLSDQLTLLFTHKYSVLEDMDLSTCGLTSADGDTLLDACRQGRLPQLTKIDIHNIYGSEFQKIPKDKIDRLKENIKEVKLSQWT